MNIGAISLLRSIIPSFIAGLILSLAPFPGSVAATSASELERQRSEFLAAEKAFAARNQREYRRLKQGLKSYPLYPYLEYQELRSQIGSVSAGDIAQFLRDYADTPLARSLRIRWLNELGKRKAWRSYLAFYQPDKSITRTCLYLSALIETGKSETAMEEVKPIWLSGSSRPKECDPVFEAWIDRGHLSSELVWQRIELTMQKRNTKLATYLGRFLPADEKPWLDLWIQVNRSPGMILDKKRFSSASPVRERILLFGLKRLARERPYKASAAWEVMAPHYPFSNAERYQANRALALAMARHDVPDLLARLDEFSPDADDEYLLERRIREALSLQDWRRVSKWIALLPPELSSRENWTYWRARALEKTGQVAAALPIYEALAKERSYHGFLAADILGRPYKLLHQPLSIPEDMVLELASRQGFQRARELLILGRLIKARREWRNATERLSVPHLKAAAKLAQEWGWHSQAIFTLAKTNYWDDLELRFPLEHQRQIENAANRQQLDKSWILAVIRQESAFSTDAVSRAGARGLMQLMPATAKQTAKQMKRKPPSRNELLTPDTNIDLGTAYLRMVYDKFFDNRVLAISAYNAGPHRVDRWLPENKPLEADIWVEIIPFKETRRYTQRVLAYSVIYDRRLGNEVVRLSSLMPSVLPRKSLIASR